MQTNIYTALKVNVLFLLFIRLYQYVPYVKSVHVDTTVLEGTRGYTLPLYCYRSCCSFFVASIETVDSQAIDFYLEMHGCAGRSEDSFRDRTEAF